MDLASLATAMRAAADRERHFLASIAKKTEWPPGGLFLPRAALVPQLEAAAMQLEMAATVLAAIGGRTGLIVPDDMIHVRARVVEPQGDVIIADIPAHGGRPFRAWVASAAVTLIEPRHDWPLRW